MCNVPELAAEVTLQPIRRFGFDAAILFSDILVPLVPMGADLTFNEGAGPRISNVLRTSVDVAGMKVIDPDHDLTNVLKAIRIIRRELSSETALIGFAGAPFTLASYWVEGGKPDPFRNLKTMMYQDPTTFHQMMNKLSDTVADSLSAMVRSGANAVQVFDTWGGILPAHEFRAYNLPYLKKIFTKLQSLGVPLTYFVKDGGHLLQDVREVGATVVGIDWRTSLSVAHLQLGNEIALQGNLDPTMLFAPEQMIRSEARRIMSEATDLGGFIFNLGHGILPQTPISSVECLIDEIKCRKI